MTEIVFRKKQVQELKKEERGMRDVYRRMNEMLAELMTNPNFIPSPTINTRATLNMFRERLRPTHMIFDDIEEIQNP